MIDIFRKRVSITEENSGIGPIQSAFHYIEKQTWPNPTTTVFDGGSCSKLSATSRSNYQQFFKIFYA